MFPLLQSAPSHAAAPAATSQHGARPRAQVRRVRSERGFRRAVGATVERLVQVVPDWMLALVGGLGALTLAFGALSAAVTVRAGRSERQRRRLVQDVGLLQSALLPELPPQIGAAAVTAAYRPSGEPAAGGDFYDAFELPGGRTGVIVGDVDGHGRRALPLTALVRYTIRAHLESGLEPRTALQAANAVLFNQLRGQMVTVVAAVYEPLTGHLTYACAGHPQPILVGAQHAPVAGAASPPIGAGAPTGRRQVVVALPPGTAAWFYTDGVADAASVASGHDSLAARVRVLGAEAAAADVVQPLARGARDDMTACVLRPLPDAAAPRPLHVEQYEVRGPDLMLARAFLDECGVGSADVAAAVREARSAIARTGAAILEVECREPEPAVSVRLAEFHALPLQPRVNAGDRPVAATG